MGLIFMKFENHEEIIGMLDSIETSDKNKMETTLSIKGVIELPITAYEQSKLVSLIGKKIAIFNYNGEYKLRLIKKKIHIEICTAILLGMLYRQNIEDCADDIKKTV